MRGRLNLFHCVESRKCHSAEELLSRTNPLRPEYKVEHVFRGHGDDRWQLIPSAARGTSGSNGEFSWDVLREEWADDRRITSRFEHFRIALEDQGVPLTKSGEIDSVKGIAQHYGLPTTLLDWTRSPYVAAWFAANENLVKSIKGPLSVWAVKKKSSPMEKLTHQHSWDQDIEIVEGALTLKFEDISPVDNPNMRAQ